MKQLQNLKKRMENHRSVLVKQTQKTIEGIDKMLLEIEGLNKDKKHCEKCFGRDIRILIEGKYFCKSCGHDTRKQSAEGK